MSTASTPTTQQLRVLRKLAARTGTTRHIELAIALGVTYESAMDTISRQWAVRHRGIPAGPYA